jgi:hypothetical protein
MADAIFLCGNISEISFHRALSTLSLTSGLATAIVDNRQRIRALVGSAVEWIAPDGSLYIKVLQGSDVASFNRSRFSQRTAFAVTPRLDDYSKWQFEDIGGLHVMARLPREDFLEILVPPLNLVEVYHNGGFMVDLIARGRR